MKKRCLMMIVLTVLLCLFAGTAFAAVASSVSIDGITLNSSMPYLWQGGTQAQTAAPTGTTGYAHFSGGTLTLKSFSRTATTSSALYASGDLTIVFSGSNSLVSATSEYYDVCGIEVNGHLTINGTSGSLTGRGNTSTETTYGKRSMGICCSSLTVQGAGTVYGTGGATRGDSIGISTGAFVMEGSGTVSASAAAGRTNATSYNTYNYGIAASKVTVSSGTVKATSTEARHSYGLYLSSSGNVSVASGATLTVTGGSALASFLGEESIGLYTTGSVTVEGKLTATGSSAVGSRGIDAQNITVNGGTVTATGGTASGTADSFYDNGSWGVNCEGTLTMNGGTMTATGGQSQTKGPSYGVYAGSIVMTDGTLDCTNSTSKGVNAGVWANSLNLSGGYLRAIGHTASDSYSAYGLYVKTLSGSIGGSTKVIATSGSSTGASSVGWYIGSGNLNVSGQASMTANGVGYADGSYSYGLQLGSGNLTLAGDAVMSVSAKSCNDYNHGVVVGGGTATIQDNARLTISAAASTYANYGLSAANVTVTGSPVIEITGGAHAAINTTTGTFNGGTITVSAEDYGVYGKNLTFGGTANVTATAVPNGIIGAGICARTSMTVTGSAQVNASASAGSSTCTGVYATYVEVNSETASLTATGGDDDTSGHGLWLSKLDSSATKQGYKVTAGTLSASGANLGVNVAAGTGAVSGGTVTASGKSQAFSIQPDIGSYAYPHFTVSNDASGSPVTTYYPTTTTYKYFKIEPGQPVVITVTTRGSWGCTAEGGGTFREGDSVTLTATPNAYSTFTGWYVLGGSRVSTAQSYTFRATTSRDMIAMFENSLNYTLTDNGDGTSDLTIAQTIDDEMMQGILSTLGPNTIGTLTVTGEGVLDCAAATVIPAAQVVNNGTISGGDLQSAVTTNNGLINGGYFGTLMNTAAGEVNSLYLGKDEDGDSMYRYPKLYGAIENDGNIYDFSYQTGKTTVVRNDGYLAVEVSYNSGWDWDDGWGWDSDTAIFNYGSRVGDVLGEGFYRTDGTYAIDDTLGLYTQLYHHWTRQESGSIYVKAAFSSSPVHITADMAGDATSIYVAMGRLITDELSIPVVLSNIECEDGTHYYTSGISGGVYNGPITVHEPGYLSNCTINGTLTLNSGTSIAQSVQLGSAGQVMVNSLNEITNIWGPSISSYYLPMTVAEGGSIAIARNFYGDITNYGTLSGGTFNGKVLDYSAHEHAPGAGGESVSWTRWDGAASLSLATGHNYVALVCDVSTSSGITVENGQHLHLCLDGSDLIRTSNGAVITVNEGGTLSLCDCSAQSRWGKVTSTASNGRGVNINRGSMYMYSGKVADNLYTSDGAGVCVFGGAAFTMHGGEISGNSDGGQNWIQGGGVLVDYGSTFTMYGGKISGNAAERGAGVRVSNSSFLYMHGGEISGNTAASYGGGIYSPGNDVIEITGGSITGNTASREGGAIFNNAFPLTNTQITMTGGSISGNTAAEAAGGVNGPVTLGGSAVISGNKLTGGTASNLECGNYLLSLEGEFTGTAYVKPAIPSLGSVMPFLKRDGGAVTADDLAHFKPDNTAYALYVDENGQGVLGQKTYTLTLENAQTADGKTTAEIAPGTEVSITAVIPEGQVFARWENGAGEVLEAKEAVLTLVMPLGNETLRAVTVDEFVVADGVLTAYNGEDKELIVLPQSVTAIDEAVFAACPGLKTVVLSGAASEGFVDTLPGIDKFFVTDGSLIRYLGDKTDVVLPDCVVTINESVTAFPAGVQSVTGPCVTRAVFGPHEVIARVSLPQLSDVPSFAFRGLSALEEIDLPKAVTIGENAFSGCAALTEAVLPETTALGQSAFAGCTALESFSAPKLGDLPTRAFSDCRSLTSFAHDLSAPYTIGDEAFWFTGLTDFDLTNATAIGSYAFLESGLTSVLVPDTVTAIGDMAFDKTVLIRSSVSAHARTWAQENGYAWEHDQHNETVLPAQELTCTTDGKTEGLWCPECEAILVEQIVTPAPGHATVTDEAVDPTCTRTGLTEGSHCETCGEVFIAQEELEALGHTEDVIPGFEPTCTEPGVTDCIFCTVCGEEFQAAEEIPAKGHNSEISKEAVAPTCTEAGSTAEHACSVCGEVLEPSQPLAPQGHSEYESIGAVEPDCVHAGHTAEIICGVCGVVLNPSEEIPALGHTEEVVEAVAPTCTQSGLTEGSRCTVCGDMVVEQTELPALGHSPETDAAVEPTDRETGLTEGSHCSVCGEVLTEQQVIPANFSWDGDVITGYNRTNPVVVIPADATGLGDTAFTGNSIITSVTVGDNILTLGTQTFMNCENLEDVYLPDHLNNIGARTFYGTDARVHCSAEGETAVALSFRGVPFTTPDGWTLRYRVTSLTGTPGGTWIVKYAGEETTLTIPDQFGGANVTQILEDAFSANEALASVVIPETVTLISDRAFQNCTSLASVNFPGALKTIGAYAFQNTAITAAALPSGLTVAGEGAFAGCKQLSSVTLPQSLVSVSDYLFDGCAKLSGLKLPEGIASMGQYALRGCVKQTTVNVPASVASISKGAFYGCTRLSAATLPEGIANLPEELFAYCTLLKSVNIPQSVTAIGEKAFFMCEALPSAILNEGVTEIGPDAFKGCTALSELVLPDSLTTIGEGAFAYCSALGQLVLPDGVTAIGADVCANGGPSIYCNAGTTTAQTLDAAGYGYSPLLTIRTEEKADGTVDTILTGCVYFLKEVVVPEGVTKIANYAFQSHENLEKITLPSTLESIGYHAFSGCKALTSIEIPDSVYAIGQYAFSFCYSLASVKLPAELTVIENDLFYHCEALASIEIPQSVEIIGDSAFQYCTALQNVVIPQSVTTIGQYAFSGCSIQTLHLPDGITSLTEDFGKDGIDVIYIPRLNCDTVTTLASATSGRVFCLPGDDTLGYDASLNEDGSLHLRVRALDQTLTEVVIPEGVNATAYGAFAGLRQLTSVSFPTTLSKLDDHTFDNCTALEEITIPATVKEVGDNLFYNCTSLKKATLEEGVTSIGNYAFYDCAALESIVLPEGVTSIGEHAFFNCYALTAVTVPDSLRSIGKYAFANCNLLAEIHLPANVTIGYQAINMTLPVVPALDCQTAFEACASGDNIRYAVEGDEMFYYRAETDESGASLFTLVEADAAITEAIIPDGVTAIGDQALSGHSQLISVVMPDSVTSMGTYVFQNCETLETVKLSANLKAIPDRTFDGCYALKNIEIPQGVESIGAYAFRYCQSLGSLTLPQSVTTLGEQVFLSSLLEKLYMPDHITSMYASSINTVRGVYVSSFDCDTAKLIVSVWPDRYIRLNGQDTLQYNLSFAEDGSRSIQVKAVGTDLTEAVIAQGTTHIAEQAFYNCTQLASVTIPEGVTSIGESAFQNCTALEGVSLPEGVTAIGSQAFEGCTALKTVTIPQSVAQMDPYTFHNCSSLASVTLEEGATFVGEHAFVNCKALKDVNLPGTLTAIKEHAFNNCTALTSLTVPDGVVTIGEYAFCNCYSLTELRLPANVAEMGMHIVNSTVYPILPQADCLTAFTFSSLGDYYYQVEGDEGLCLHAHTDENGEAVITLTRTDEALMEVVVPEAVTALSQYAVTNADAVVKLHDHVKNISAYAISSRRIVLPSMTCQTAQAMVENNPNTFWYLPEDENLRYRLVMGENGETGVEVKAAHTAITEAVIPEGVTIIGDKAFESCTALERILIPDGVTQIASTAFHNSPDCLIISSHEAFARTWAKDNGLAWKHDEPMPVWDVRPATRESDGMTRFEYCSGCGEMLTEGTVIPHDRAMFLPAAIREIADEAFVGSRAMQVTLPEGAQSIGSRAFADCDELLLVVIPSTVTYIADDAFEGSPNAILLTP